MKKNISLSFLLLIFLFSACEEVIDYELDTAATKLVVEGLITNQPGPYNVRLSQTKGYLDNGSNPAVTGAQITILDNQGHSEVLQEAGEGLYRTNTLQGIPGNTYYLKVVVNGKEYTAQAFMPPVAPIDSLTFKYKTSANEDDEGYHPYIHFNDPAGKGNYYRWNVYINGVLEPDELVAVNDEIFDGKHGDVDMLFALKEGDKLKVELISLDKPAFEFWKALMYQQDVTGGPFDTTPANAPGNLSSGAIGYFGASAVSVIEGTVPTVTKEK